VAGAIRESSNDAEKMVERSKRELSSPEMAFFETKFIGHIIAFIS